MRAIEIKRCRICGDNNLAPILNLGNFALSGVFPTKRDAEFIKKSPLELVKCSDCGLLQLKHSISPEELFTGGYGYRSGINETMVDHLINIVRKVENIVSLEIGDVVLDIGSNDGTLLKQYTNNNVLKIGMDPIITQFNKYYPDEIIQIGDFFNANGFLKASDGRKAKVITSIAIVYDLEEPLKFANDIKKVMKNDGIWILELSYMPSMLINNSFDTICHEHLEYYALKQIEWIVKKNDMRIFDVLFNEVNGGSFQVYVCHQNAVFPTNEKKLQAIKQSEKELKLDTLYPYKEFAKRITKIKEKLYKFIAHEKSSSKEIHIYGASTKGNIILQFCKIDNSLISMAADRNPIKWGKVTPGTNIPIVSEKESKQFSPDYFLVLPWHFSKSFKKREEDYLNQGGKFVIPLPDVSVFQKSDP